MRCDLTMELFAERFGASVPWAERTAKPNPVPNWPIPPKDDLTKARRRRVLNEAMDDAQQHYRRSRRAA